MYQHPSLTQEHVLCFSLTSWNSTQLNHVAFPIQPTKARGQFHELHRFSHRKFWSVNLKELSVFSKYFPLRARCRLSVADMTWVTMRACVSDWWWYCTVCCLNDDELTLFALSLWSRSLTFLLLYFLSLPGRKLDRDEWALKSPLSTTTRALSQPWYV